MASAKTYTTSSDASAGMLVQEDDGTNKTKVVISAPSRAASYMSAAIQAVVRAVIEAEKADETITPLAVPAPVPTPTPAEKVESFEIQQTTNSKAQVVAHPNSPPVTPGVIPTQVVHQPEDIGRLTEVFEQGDLQARQDAAQVNEAANANPIDARKDILANEDDIGTAIEPGNVPATVPNYHRPPSGAVKTCDTCRYFKINSTGDVGECTAFSFTALSDYVCDAWQAQGSKSVYIASGPDQEIPAGEVIGPDGRPRIGFEKPQRFAYETRPNLALDHGDQQKSIPPLFLPSERVYSQTMRSLGEVVKSEFLDSQNIYSIKLIDRYGAVHGYAVVQETDLSPRSLKAIKRAKSVEVRRSIEDQVKTIGEALRTLCDRHKDFIRNPIPSRKLQAVETLCKQFLSSPDVQSVSKDTAFRKYIRAIQDVQHAVSGAGHLIESASELSQDAATSKDVSLIMQHGQKNAYERCVAAAVRAEECLLDQVPMRTLRRKGQRPDSGGFFS